MDAQKAVALACVALGGLMLAIGIGVTTDPTVKCDNHIMSTQDSCLGSSYAEMKAARDKEHERALWVGIAGFGFMTTVGIGGWVNANRRAREEEESSVQAQTWLAG